MHTRCQKKRVRRKKEAGKEGDKKSKVPPYTTPPADRPPPAEIMLFVCRTSWGTAILCGDVAWTLPICCLDDKSILFIDLS